MTILRNKLVIKLGGSLISVAGENDLPLIDTQYLEKFSNFIRKISKEVSAIFIVVGGGKVVRKYQSAAVSMGVKRGDDLDLIGMRLTRVNAELVRASIGRDLAGEIIYSGQDFHWSSKVVVGAGWGHAVTSDYNAVQATDMIGADDIVRLSNIDYIYTSDPKEDKNAEAIKSLTWKEIIKINKFSGNSEHRPGMNVPFDHKATLTADKLGIDMAFIHGHSFDEIENYLRGKDFKGTFVGTSESVYKRGEDF